MHDTSHYAECATIMQRLKSNHMKRLFILLVLILINGYFHIITMPIHSYSGFAWGGLALFHSIAVAVLGLLSTPEKPALCWISLSLVLLGMFLTMMSPIYAIPIGILFVIALIESRKAAWVKQQPGYPYFNERFAEQESKAFQDYQADHGIRERADDDMQDIAEARDIIPTPAIAEMPDVDFLIPDVSAKPATTMAAASAVSPLQAATEPPQVAAPDTSSVLSAASTQKMQDAAVKKPKKRWNFKEMMKEDQDVPKVDFDVPTDIPDPVWNVPDPVMDTGSILSTVPDISGDIQDLPDIPDIPQI